MSTISIFNYNGNNVTFEKGNNVMINATQMAKLFGKRPNDYLSLPSTKELIVAITRKSGIVDNQLITIVRGGLNPGTWMHEDIAIDFAQWLSVDFKLWCNDRIKELLQTDSTSINKLPTTYLEALKALVVVEEEKLALQEVNEMQRQVIEDYEPKVTYYDTILNSKDNLTISQISSDYGMSAKKLNSILRDLKVQYKSRVTWLLYSEYRGLGYTKSKTHIYTKADGSKGTSLYTEWTQKGRLFIYDILKQAGHLPTMERE